MRHEEKARELWTKARAILLPYDGAATELIVTDLPLEAFRYAIEQISTSVREPELIVISSESLAVPLPLTRESISRLQEGEGEAVQHSIRGSFSGDHDLCFYIWIDGKKQIFEVEMVFWNDITFPEANSEHQHIDTLARLVDLAERIRSRANSSKCILSPEHNGPTEELFSNEHVVIW